MTLVPPKTVEFPFDQRTTSLATATRYDASSITVYIPETTSRTFLSVIVDVWCQNNSTAGTDLTAQLIGIQLGAAGASDATTTYTLAGVGSGTYYHFTRDVTSYFTTNFGAGASQTCVASFRQVGPATQNISIKLTITYQHDDADNTRIKSIAIPLDSQTSNLTTSLVEIGTNQVPVLDTVLAEGGKTIRDIWFEVVGCSQCSATTDSTLSFSLDAGAAADMGLQENQAQTGLLTRSIWRQTAMTTSGTHAFKMKTSTTTSPFASAAITLHVTYEYSESGTTRVLNSLQIPFGDPADLVGISGHPTRYTAVVNIPETGSLTLRQSGVLFFVADRDLVSVSVACGSQSARTYTLNNMGSNGLEAALTHRIDSGGAAGSGITLARGNVTFTMDVYSPFGDNGGMGSCASPILILNYESDKHANGSQVHSKTTVWSQLNAYTAPDGTSARFSKYTPTPPTLPTNYYLTNVAYALQSWQNGGGASTVFIQTEILSGEFGGGPKRRRIATIHPGYADFADNVIEGYADITTFWRRWPGMPNDGGIRPLLSASSRDWIITCGNAAAAGAMLMVTSHGITGTVAGTASGYSGGGSGITINAHRYDTGELVATTTTAAGGTFTMTVYDPTLTYYTEAWQDGTHLGRSGNFTV